MNARTSCRLCATAGLLLLPLSLLGCAPMRIESAYGPGIRFDGMGETWTWAPEAKMGLRYEKVLSAEHDALVRQLIGEELGRKGYKQLTDAKPDIAVDYAVTERTRGGMRESSFAPVRSEGSLVIDVLDPATGKHIWRGYAEANLDPSLDPAVRKARLSQAVRLILKRFADAGKSPR